MNIINEIATNLNLLYEQVNVVLNMLSEGSTIPFIARYRKEATGNLNENQIKDIEIYYSKQKNFEERKEVILRLIDEKDMLTETIKLQLEKCNSLKELEDVYAPYKEKKKTKAIEAIEKGLEPLAKIILSSKKTINIELMAKEYLNEKVRNISDVLEGVKHIIAEYISNKVYFRKWIRTFLWKNALIKTKIKKEAIDEKEVYKNYYDFDKKLSYLKNYQVLAINRAEKSKIITVSFDYKASQVIDFIIQNININNNYITIINPIIEEAAKDSFKRLIKPSLEREIRSELTEKSSTTSIEIFANNLEHLLLTPTIKSKTVLGIDPGFRTGCKTAVIDEFGTPKSIGVIYLFKEEQAMKTLEELFNNYKIDVIVIGNGTASRETVIFVNKTLQKNKLNIPFTIISEAGASVYSASKVAQKEFPNLQVEQRSAISIARRYQDNLNELVKIEPKAIGIGQYQHDVNQKELENKLAFIVEKIVNQVGVDINTASLELLKYVSGLSSKVAKNIIDYRKEKGVFKNRKEIKAVKGLGSKTYEQAIGFLRIIGGDNKLDTTPIHPESYKIAKQILKDNKVNLDVVGTASELKDVDINELAKKYDSDKYTIAEIIRGISQPQRDIRDSYNAPILKTEILSIDNISIGQIMEGRVQNVTEFGAFVDLGIKEAGLIHKSNMSGKYVKNPLDIISVGKIVKIEIIDLDKKRKRIGLKLLEY